MTLPTHEFIRRFLIHVLPKGLHRIRHYGLFANGKNRAANIARARQLLAVPQSAAQHLDPTAEPDQPRALPTPCPCCGGRISSSRPSRAVVSLTTFRHRSGSNSGISAAGRCQKSPSPRKEESGSPFRHVSRVIGAASSSAIAHRRPVVEVGPALCSGQGKCHPGAITGHRPTRSSASAPSHAPRSSNGSIATIASIACPSEPGSLAAPRNRRRSHVHSKAQDSPRLVGMPESSQRTAPSTSRRSIFPNVLNCSAAFSVRENQTPAR